VKIAYINNMNVLYYIFVEMGIDVNKRDINQVIEENISINDNFLSLLSIIVSTKTEPDFKNRLIKIDDVYYMSISIKEIRDLIINYPENNEFVSELKTDVVPQLPGVFFKDLVSKNLIKPVNELSIRNPVDKFYRNVRDDILFITDLRKLDLRLQNEKVLCVFHTYELSRLYSITMRLIVDEKIKNKITEKVKSCYMLIERNGKYIILATLTLKEWSDVFDDISTDEIGMDNKIICNAYYYLIKYPNIINTLKCDQRRIVDILFDKYFKIEGEHNE
jgi:hypothetical protein